MWKYIFYRLSLMKKLNFACWPDIDGLRAIAMFCCGLINRWFCWRGVPSGYLFIPYLNLFFL